MANTKKRLFIVGNGPLLFDMTERVNASDHVVRFNEPKTSFGMSGTKTNWLFVSNTGKPMERRLNNPDYPTSPIVQAAELVFLVNHPITVEKYLQKPKLLSRLKGRRTEYTWAGLMMYGKAGKTVAVLPPSFYEASCRDLGIEPEDTLKQRIFPSTGYVGIRYALEMLPADEWEVEIAGFSWQGWQKHTWDHERAWIERKVAERGIRVWPSKNDTRRRHSQGGMMETKLDIYIGWDSREPIAYDVAKKTILDRASVPVEVHPIKLSDLVKKGAYTREIDPLASTEFTYSRFFTPWLAGYKGWALFCDCDFLFLDDVAKLLEYRDPSKAVLCVKHDYQPKATVKMDGKVQTTYPRKNWSSFMLFNCEHPSTKTLTPEVINRESGAYLHRMQWAKDEEIGGIPERWNWLEGWSEKPESGTPSAVHFTNGGPWFKDWQNVDYGDLWRAEADKVDPNWKPI